jgi:hypothetical protein
MTHMHLAQCFFLIEYIDYWSETCNGLTSSCATTAKVEAHEFDSGCRSRDPVGKLVGPQHVKKFSTLYGTLKFMTVFTRA